MKNYNLNKLNALGRKRLIPIYITSLVLMITIGCTRDEELPIEITQEKQVSTADELEILADNFNEILLENGDDPMVDASMIKIIKEADKTKKAENLSKNSSQSDELTGVEKLTIKNEPKIIDLTFELAKELRMIPDSKETDHDSEFPAYFDHWDYTGLFHDSFYGPYRASVRGHRPNRLKSYHFSGKKSDGSNYIVSKVLNTNFNYKGNRPENYLINPIRLKASPIYNANQNNIELDSELVSKEVLGNEITLSNESNSPVFVNDINNVKELIAISHSKVEGKTTTVSNSIGTSTQLGFTVGFAVGPATGPSNVNGSYNFNHTFTNETNSSVAIDMSDTETKSQPIPYGHIEMPANCNCKFVPIAEKRKYEYTQAYKLEFYSGNMSYTYLSKDFLINARDQFTTVTLKNSTKDIINDQLRWTSSPLGDPQNRRGHFADKYIFNAYSTYSVGYECTSRINGEVIKRENYKNLDDISREINITGEVLSDNDWEITDLVSLKSFEYINELKLEISHIKNRTSKIYLYLQDTNNNIAYVTIQGDGSNSQEFRFTQNDFILKDAEKGFSFQEIKRVLVNTPSANSHFNFKVISL